MSEKIRTFIAIPLPAVQREAIGNLVDRLRRTRADVRWVRGENVHITLKFLGPVDESRIATVEKAVREAVSGVDSFPAVLSGTGMFPGPHRPRVLWVGISEGGETLSLLAARVDRSLEALGFEKERRPYSPHITIGRVRSGKGVPACVEAMEAEEFDAGGFPVDEIRIMRSDLRPQGSVYTILRRIPLSQGDK
jgi:2'-5' RNA ligase